MSALLSLSMALFQVGETASPPEMKWIMIGVLVLAFVSLFQLLAFVAAGVAALRAIKEIKILGAEVHAKTMPIIAKTNAIIEDLSPKIRSVSENVTQVSYTVRAKVEEVGEQVSHVTKSVGQTITEVNQTVQETNAKTRGQVNHVDRIVTSALTSTENMKQTVINGIQVPIKQAAGVIAGFRATYEALIKNFAHGGGPRPGDHDGKISL